MPVDPALFEISRLVKQSLQEVADISSTSRVSFEGGDYERLYVRPGPALASSLVASREILVLITAFRELQTRTIRMAEVSLRQGGGRLEPGMVVIVHLDKDGNEVLRRWGRERGLTILPIYARAGVPSGTDLEAILCSSLYVHDPFDLSGPVRGTGQFFGRTDTPDVARRLRTGQIHTLFGIRKIGKTSVLNRLVEESRDFHGTACAVTDCSDDSLSALDAGSLLNSIAGAINDAVDYNSDRYSNAIPLRDFVSASEAARTLLNILASSEFPVLLAFDEVDYITPSSPVAPHWRTEFNPFFRALRHVYQECTRREISFSIVLCGVSSRWFTTEAIDGVENAALAFVPENYLPPLENYQAVQMIQTLGRSAGLVVSHDGSRLVAETCGHIPYWIRKAGSYIHSCFAQDDRPIKLRYPDLAPLMYEFVAVEGGQLAFSSLRHLFRIFPAVSKVAMGALKDEDVRLFSHGLVSTLGRYGVLGAGFEPAGPMMQAGLALWEAEESTADGVAVERKETLPDGVDATQSALNAISAGSMSAPAEEEWAELLGEVSTSRNKLERTLREFVATVLRIEAARRTDGRRPVDLCISSLRAERRIELQGKSLNGVMSALYWIELIAVIKKNWSLFERFFHDRKDLELWADIVNDRPDAHAKSFDGAELALQRRAIRWFDDRVEASDVL